MNQTIRSKQIYGHVDYQLVYYRMLGRSSIHRKYYAYQWIDFRSPPKAKISKVKYINIRKMKELLRSKTMYLVTDETALRAIKMLSV